MSNSKNNFESSLKKLEKIVAKLEEGNIDLDDSIKSFEEGVMLVKECQKQLSEAELKVCLLYTSPSPRDKRQSRMPSSA